MQRRPDRLVFAALAAVAVGSALVNLGLRRSSEVRAREADAAPVQATQTRMPTNWQAEASVFGVVVDASATERPPVAGARVIVHAHGLGCDPSVVTDASGAFDLSCYDLHFENLYHLHVVADGYQPWINTSLMYGRQEVAPALERIPSLPSATPTPYHVSAYVMTKGTVRDAVSEAPLGGVLVGVGSAPNCLSPVRSASDGSYELVCPYVLHFNTYRMTASLRGYREWALEMPGYRVGGVVDIALERDDVAPTAGTPTAATPTAGTPMAGTPTEMPRWTVWLPVVEAGTE